MGGGPGLDRARRVTLRCVEICLLQASSVRGWLTRVRTLACDGLSKTTRLLGEKIRPTHITYGIFRIAGAGRKKGWSSRGAGARAWRARRARVRAALS